MQFLSHIVPQWFPYPSIPPVMRFQISEGNPFSRHYNQQDYAYQKAPICLCLSRLSSPHPLDAPADAPTTVHAHRGIPPNILCSFQKMCLDHSTTVGTRKAALKVAFKVVNWWRCQHIVFIPKSWSLFWDHLRASKVCPLARKISVLWALLQILSTCHKGNV